MGLSNSWPLTNFKAKKIGAIFKVKTPKKKHPKINQKKHPEKNKFAFCFLLGYW